MSRLFYHVMQDNAGNLLFDVSGTFRLAGTGTLATIYGNEGLTVVLPNPMTNHPSFGSFKCYLGEGSYDFYMAKAGYTFETLAGVQGWGTMALQNANAVAITGGNATGLGALSVGPPPTGSNKFTVEGGNSYFGQPVGMQWVSTTGISLAVGYLRPANHGLMIVPSADTGVGNAILFANASVGAVGSITTTATVTSYNVSSDARLKEDVQPLEGALDVLRALKPVRYRWKADGSPGRGLLAQEVQEVIPDGVITGEKDAVDDEGNVLPQMIDYSKLVPYLIGAVKELTQQVETLTAKLAGA